MDTSSLNRKYLIVLTARSNLGDVIRLETPMPENFSVNLNIDWAAQYANVVQDSIDKIGGKTGQLAGYATKLVPVFGHSTQTKIMTAQIWQGTSGLELSVPFIFKANTSTDSEVISPIKQLMQVALPSVSKLGTLVAPFSPLDAVQSGDNGGVTIDITFGEFFRLPSCVITSISQSYDSIFDYRGNPISAKVDVQVRSYYVITREDIDLLLRHGARIN